MPTIIALKVLEQIPLKSTIIALEVLKKILTKSIALEVLEQVSYKIHNYSSESPLKSTIIDIYRVLEKILKKLNFKVNNYSSGGP